MRQVVDKRRVVGAVRDVMARRVAGRQVHVLPVTLLDSQSAVLGRLGPEEFGAEIDIARPCEQVVAKSEGKVRETLV